MNRDARNTLRASAALAGAVLAVAGIVWTLSRPGPLTEGPAAGKSKPSAASVPSDIELRDVTTETTIDFVHTDGSSGRRYVMEPMTGGLALFDYDGDGLVDVYFVNGAPLPGAKPDKTPRHALYRNLGKCKFKEVTEEAGVACTAYGMGIAVGDYNNDGAPDLYVSNFGPNVLYRNNGDGTFTDVTREAGVVRGDRVGAGVSFLDADADGDLDLFVSNYVKFSYDTHRVVEIQGVPLYPGPLDHDPEENLLYRNHGDGTFSDASRESGIAGHAGTGMGIIACDYDNDGDTDVYVANDAMANFLFQNDGRGRFREVGIPSGVAYDGGGVPQSSMGVDAGDYDNDGFLDFYVTSYQNEVATLYRNLGNGFFHDATRMTGAGEGTLAYVTWGNGFVDFDNDGDRDLYVACGHTDDNIALRDPSASYAARNQLLKNFLAETGRARFANVSGQSGDGLSIERVSRGTGFDDLDNDGDIDVVVLNSRGKPTILRNMLNERGSPNHWLQVRLLGVKSNREGVGAHVRVVAGNLVQVDEVHGGRGYQSHHGARLHFGLGPRTRVDRIEVRWIGGGTDVLENVPTDQLITIKEAT